MARRTTETPEVFLAEVNRLALSGLASAEIAAAMGLKPATLRKRLSRYKARFVNVAGYWQKDKADETTT
jgi:DNA-directed RNA polymerase specialized sigma24 family protein